MKIDLDYLGSGIMGLTPEFGNFCLQACSVCLENFNHMSNVKAGLLNSKKGEFEIVWKKAVTKQVQRNWKDMDEATEYGATAIAILLTKELTKFRCIERSSKGTGFDYWLGDEDDLGIFQQKDRLEISGILSESKSNSVSSRLKVKEKQVKKTKHLNMNAHICIMEFSNPKCAYTIKK